MARLLLQLRKTRKTEKETRIGEKKEKQQVLHKLFGLLNVGVRKAHHLKER